MKFINFCIILISFFIVNSTHVFAGATHVSYIDLSGSNTNVEKEESNTLTIKNDIKLQNGEILVLYVNGNVEIDATVAIAKSIFIVATGTITTIAGASNVDDVSPSDNPLRVYGGLYSSNINFWRDIKDTDATGNFDFTFYPSTQILYNPALIAESNTILGTIPPEIGISNVYWNLKE